MIFILKRAREALRAEFQQIYMMGYDTWGKDETKEAYLAECQGSTKYQRGTWWVLSDKRTLFSSLIVYNLEDHCLGIGSVATDPIYRHKGNASLLLKAFIATHSDDKLLLFSDIDPAFYEKIGFKKVLKGRQPYQETTLMYYPQNVVVKDLQIPNYF
ncbi:GNAT family N-acetyltransferase (plasmid) [Lacticaseibacillus paracasei]|uniref:GNAT family N-acetyltransferase n=1 Tax=Lacticaseibacillus paracasei TaxID=1597 RepID=UPI0035931AB8